MNTQEALHLRRDAARRQPRHPPPVQRRPRAARSPRALDAAGVDCIEVAHGDGLRRLQLQLRLRRAHRPGVDRGRRRTSSKHAKIATLLLPGIGTDARPAAAYDAGARVVRVATHCTEADVSRQHIEYARDLGHGRRRLPDDEPHDRRRRAGRAGEADGELRRAPACYVVDSGGALDMNDVRDRFRAFKDVLKPETRDRHARAPQPEPGRRELASSPWRKAATASTPAWPAWARARATRRWKCSSPRPSGMGWNHGCDLYRADGCGRRPRAPAAGPPGARGPRDAGARLCRRVLELPAPRRSGREQVRPEDRSTSWSNSAGARWSAARKT